MIARVSPEIKLGQHLIYLANITQNVYEQKLFVQKIFV